uniref:(northern house mosquito) hypothetical protein n=1 Tax=Culex pipiens TaxID=7175 RepID=A0A8D8AWM8_CULPI
MLTSCFHCRAFDAEADSILNSYWNREPNLAMILRFKSVRLDRRGLQPASNSYTLGNDSSGCNDQDWLAFGWSNGYGRNVQQRAPCPEEWGCRNNFSPKTSAKPQAKLESRWP